MNLAVMIGMVGLEKIMYNLTCQSIKLGLLLVVHMLQCVPGATVSPFKVGGD